MSKKKYCIGVLTSGGDAPGMNSAIRSVVRTGIHHDMKVIGVYEGFYGLLSNQFQEMTIRSVSNILGQGGTSLYSARCPEFKQIENVKKAVDNCKKAGIDGLVVIGGDGSFRGAKDLSEQGLPCIGIPGTIDNDIASTDYTLGFDTAVNTVVENVDKLRDTMQSHARCSVVEVMGRNCGDIALYATICIGGVSVLIPEIEFSVDKDIIEPMKKTLKTGKNHFIIIMAEGVTGKMFTDGDEDDTLSAGRLAQYIEKKTGVESRATVIGHVQRGGRPTGSDRVLGSEFGNKAVNLLRKGKGNRVVAIHENKIVSYDIFEALKMQKEVDTELVRVATEISI